MRIYGWPFAMISRAKQGSVSKQHEDNSTSRQHIMIYDNSVTKYKENEEYHLVL